MTTRTRTQLHDIDYADQTSGGITAQTARNLIESIYLASEVDTALSNKADTSALSGYATTSALASKADTSALSGYATTSALSSKADASALANYATTSALASKADTSALSNYATTSAIANKADTSALANYATTSALASKADTSALSNYATTSALANYIAKVADSNGNGFDIVDGDGGSASVRLNYDDGDNGGWLLKVFNEQAALNILYSAEYDGTDFYEIGFHADHPVTVYANKFEGDGSLLSGLTGSTTITSVGTLTSLNVSGQTTEYTGIDFSQVACPSTMAVALANDGGTHLGIGQYYYAISYVTALGETNPINGSIWNNQYALVGNTVTTTSGNRRVTVTLPVSSDARVTGRKIYRSTCGGGYWALQPLVTITNNSATSYVDDIADSGLSAGNGFTQDNTTNKLITINGMKAMRIGLGATCMGTGAGNNLTTAAGNTLYGNTAGYHVTSGNNNTLIGDSAGGYQLATGTYNTAVGALALYEGTGSCNTSIGGCAAYLHTSGDFNTWIGYAAGEAIATYSSSVMVGAYSGCYETASYKLFIDGLDRGSEAAGRTNSLIYGEMNYTPTSQKLYLNGVVFPVQAPSAPAYVKGGLYFDTTLNKLRVGGATAWETVTSA